jgi:hypothetical protein
MMEWWIQRLTQLLGDSDGFNGLNDCSSKLLPELCISYYLGVRIVMAAQSIQRPPTSSYERYWHQCFGMQCGHAKEDVEPRVHENTSKNQLKSHQNFKINHLDMTSSHLLGQSRYFVLGDLTNSMYEQDLAFSASL